MFVSMKSICVAACLTLACFSAVAQQPATASPAPSKNVSCKADKEPLSPAQIEFEQNEYKTAADHFVTELAAHPDKSSLRAWQIRNLLAQGNITEASTKVNAWVTEKPDSGLALTTKAEVLMRQGQLPESYMMASQAQKLDPCNGRAYYVLSEYEQMIALYATEKKHVDLAHVLNPNDDEITGSWIFLKPKAQALEEYRKFVESSVSFTEKQRTAAKARLTKYGDKPHEPECKLTSATKESTIPFSAIRFSPDSPPAYGLEMSFNGKKRRLELDTGASGLTLTAGAAERLGLTVEDTAFLGGVGDEGAQKSKVTHVASLKIGDLEFSNCAVYILPPRDMEAASYGFPVAMEEIDGLIGGDVFQKFLLTLDYPAGELRVSQLPARQGDQTSEMSLNTSGGAGSHSGDGVDEPLRDRYKSPEMADWTQFYRIYHYLLIPTQLNDGPIKLMMADTGAAESIIDPNAARTVTKVSTTGRVSLVGISGHTQQNYLTDKIVLHFGKLYLPLNSMISVPTDKLSEGAGVDISGFLGFPALRQMTLQIDYRDGLIHFAYDPKRPVNSKFQSDAFTQR